MTIKKFIPREYFRKKKIAVVSNIDNEIIHLFLKKEFRSYEIVSQIPYEQIISAQSFHFFLTQLAQYGIHISNKREGNDLVIAVLTYEFHDEYHTKVPVLVILIAKNEVVEKEIVFLEKIDDKKVRILTIEILKRLYTQIKNPHAL